MRNSLLIMLAVFLVPVQGEAQTQVAPPLTRSLRDTASAELEAVLVEAGKLDDKMAIVSVKARAAGLISLSDPARAEILFRDVWKFAKDQSDEGFDTDHAFALILKQVIRRHPKLAKTFLSEEVAPAASGTSVTSQRDLNSPRKTKLASQLVDENPRVASEILEQTLANGFTTTGLNAVLKLRVKNALLSDFVVGKAIEGLRGQPDNVALSGLHLLSVYVFPEGINVELSQSLEALQFQYFGTTYDVLRASLGRTDADMLKNANYTKADLQRRLMYQAQVALMLSALATRFAPIVVAELNALANKLGPQLPENVAQLARAANARLSGKQETTDHPQMAIPLALQSGDFDEAKRLIEGLKDGEVKALFSDLLLKAEARSLLASGDALQAIARIRKMEDRNARLVFYLDTLKATQKKADHTISTMVINEARQLIPQAGRNGVHVRTLLAFVTQPPTLASADEALGFVNAAVLAINSLAQTSPEEPAGQSQVDHAWAEINDPRSLMDQPEFSQAFSAVALLDFDRAIIEARKLSVKPLQLAARLETAGEVMRMDARTQSSKARSKTVATRSDQ